MVLTVTTLLIYHIYINIMLTTYVRVLANTAWVPGNQIQYESPSLFGHLNILALLCIQGFKIWFFKAYPICNLCDYQAKQR